MKKIIALLIVFCMLFVLAAGCAAKTEAPAVSEEVSQAPEESAAPAEEPAPPAEETPAEEAPVEEPSVYPISNGSIHFSYCYQHMPALNNAGIESYGDNPSWQYAQEQTGVTIDWMPFAPQAFNEKIALMFASNELPDITFGISYADGTDAAIEDGYVVNIQDYFDYCPNYKGYLDADPELYEECKTEGGNLAVFNMILDQPYRIDSGMMIRQDWLDKLGLDTPNTFDDLENVLKAFKTEYNANLGLFSYLCYTDQNLCGSYGVAGYTSAFPTGAFYIVDGEVRYGVVQEEYKQYLTLINDWYNEGLLSDDVLLSDARMLDTSSAQVANGEVGVWYGWVDCIPAWNASIGEGANVMALADPVINDGDTVHFGGQSDSLKANDCYYICATCEHIPEAVQFMDWFYTEEGIVVANYGIEGVTYNVEDGKYILTDLITNNPDGLGAVNAMQGYGIYSIGTISHVDRFDCMYSDAEIESFDILAQHKDNAYEFPKTVMLNQDESSQCNKVMEDIKTYISENILAFGTGIKPMDEFDAFVDQIYNLGLQDAIDIYQSAYDRCMGK